MLFISFRIFSINAYSFCVSLNSSHFVACVDILKNLGFYFIFWLSPVWKNATDFFFLLLIFKFYFYAEFEIILE